MKKVLLVFFLLAGFFLCSYSQNPLVKKWDKRFGGTNKEQTTCFQQTTDGGYILGGYSMSGISGDKTQAGWGYNDYWIVKLDSLGNALWDKDFGGTDNDYLSSLQQTTDGGYILGGYSFSGIGGDKTQALQGGSDFWIIKIDSLGNRLWDKDFGGTDYDYLYSIQQTTDRGYILGGWSYSGIGGDKTQAGWGQSEYWIVKTDSVGNKLWDKDFGGAVNDVLNSLQQTTDGGYILGGYSFSGSGGDKTQACWGNDDYWIVKTDSLGNKLWDKDFGGTDYDELYSLQQTTDGGYILAGTTLSGIGGNKTLPQWGFGDYWLVKTDSLGNKLWEKDFGGTSWEDEFGNVFQTRDKGFLVTGTSYSPISGDKTENDLGIEQTWIVKTDSMGTKQWDKTLITPGHDETGYAIQTRDGCYAFANYDDGGVGGYRTQSSQGNYDYWIIKFCDSTMVTLPQSSFISSDTSFCAEPLNCISFFDYSTGNPTSWQWSFPGGTPSSSALQNPDSICYSTPGTYPVTLIVGNNSGYDTLTVANMIIVGGAPPNPTITVVGSDTLISSHGLSYQWFLNGNVISGATDSSWVASQTGTYSVRITGVGGCSSVSAGQYVDVNSVNDLSFSNSDVAVIPNPSRGKFSVAFNHPCSHALIKVYNMLGEEIFAETIPGGLMKKDVELDASPGVYFLVVVGEKSSVVKKVVVE